MSVDLMESLSGQPSSESAPRPARGDVVTTIDCPCGGRLALLHRAAGRAYVWVAGYRHTRRATADLLRDAALNDAETLLRDEDQTGIEAVRDFLAVDVDALAALVPPLTFRARDVDVGGIASHFVELRRQRPGVVTKPDAFLAECRDCRTMRDLAEAVLQLEPMPDPPRRHTVSDGPEFGPASIAYDWPKAGRSLRVALYQQLSAVLTS